MTLWVEQPASGAEPQVLTVSELTRRIKELLEGALPAVWVSGEITDLARPRSGHIYFTLKDADAQLRVVMWRSAAQRLRFELEDGLAIVCGGGLDVYAPRGVYQLIAREIEPLGLGALQLAFRQLHARLAAEGLFHPARKRALPRFPRRVAFVTSPTGAAVRDFLEVLRRRWRGVDVLIIPASVQGERAAAEIARGIQSANRLRPLPDVLVVGRGGGSMDDLWCFNDEMVVRAIVASAIPVVSAVGHEIDVTLADLAADVRALTPSEAAERIAPASEELLAGLQTMRRRLQASLRARATTARSRLDALAQRRVFRRPFAVVHDATRRVDELSLRVTRAVQFRRATAGERLQSLAARLETLSPLHVLGRGYSLTEQAATGDLVARTQDVAPGDLLITRLADGRITSRTLEVHLEHPPPRNGAAE